MNRRTTPMTPSRRVPVRGTLPWRLRPIWIAVMGLAVAAGLIRACWRGELPLWFATGVLAAGCGLMGAFWNVVGGLLPAGPLGLLDLAVLTAWAGCLWLTLGWAGVGFWRSLKASQDDDGSAIVAVGALLLMAASGAHSWSSARQVSCYSGSLWRETLAARDSASWKSRAVMTYDGATRTLWLRGAIELGAAAEFRAALKSHPLTQTVGLVSPGGYVLEARVMAEDILKRGLDTYAPEKCASACVDLFAAGEKRWIGPLSVFGLHRSGHECAPDAGPTSHDLTAADFLSSRGVAASFIERALDTPYDSIWVPDSRAVLASGLATGLRESSGLEESNRP